MPENELDQVEVLPVETIESEQLLSDVMTLQDDVTFLQGAIASSSNQATDVLTAVNQIIDGLSYLLFAVVFFGGIMLVATFFKVKGAVK